MEVQSARAVTLATQAMESVDKDWERSIIIAMPQMMVPLAEEKHSGQSFLITAPGIV